MRHARVAAALVLAACIAAPPAAFAALLPPADPAANAPSPMANLTCSVSGGVVVSGPCAMVGGTVTWLTPALSRAVTSGIDRARAAEGLPALAPPPDSAAGLLDLIDAERGARGLPPVAGLSPALDAAAASAAAARTDPRPTTDWSGHWGAVWGEAPDLADVWFNWMYADGWGGSQKATPNLDCTRAAAPGCWAHRNILLGNYGPTPVAGLGLLRGSGGLSVAVVLTDGPGHAFLDLAGVPWAAPAVAALQHAGVVEGLSGHRFGPDRPVTYAELAVMADRLFHWSGAPAAVPYGTPAWADTALGLALAQGDLPAGVAPNEAASRGATVALLEAALGWSGGAGTATNRGLLCGTGDGLDLGAPLTRAQAAVFAYRAGALGPRTNWSLGGC